MRSRLDELEPRRRAEEPAPPPAPEAELGRLSAAGLVQLQQRCGNAALARLMTRPQPAPAGGHSETFSYDLRATIRCAEPGGADRPPPVAAAASGDAHEGEAKQIEHEEVAPFIVEPPVEAEAQEPAAPEGGAPQPVRLPDIEFPELAALRSTDPIAPTLSYAGTATRGGITLAATEFGSCHWGDVKVANIVVTPVTAPAKSFTVTARLDHTVRWDVRSGTGPRSEVNIPSTSAAAITSTNWTDVADALTPDMSSDNGRPPRTGFWAQDLTERHEKFHADDVRTFGPAGVRLAETWLKGKTATTVSGVEALLNTVPGRVVDSLIASYAPEDEKRAYGDGAPSYTARSDLIRSKGRKGDYP